jgi:hypothetical protein
MYSAACFVFSFAVPATAGRLGRKLTHGLCLAIGAIGLISVAFYMGIFNFLHRHPGDPGRAGVRQGHGDPPLRAAYRP